MALALAFHTWKHNAQVVLRTSKMRGSPPPIPSPCFTFAQAASKWQLTTDCGFGRYDVASFTTGQHISMKLAAMKKEWELSSCFLRLNVCKSQFPIWYVRVVGRSCDWFPFSRPVLFSTAPREMNQATPYLLHHVTHSTVSSLASSSPPLRRFFHLFKLKTYHRTFDHPTPVVTTVAGAHLIPS